MYDNSKKDKKIFIVLILLVIIILLFSIPINSINAESQIAAPTFTIPTPTSTPDLPDFPDFEHPYFKPQFSPQFKYVPQNTFSKIEDTSNLGSKYISTYTCGEGKLYFISYRHSERESMYIDEGESQIYMMDIDGSNEVQLTSEGYETVRMRLSPDGTKIVFTSNRSGNQDIFVMDSDGSNQIQLTESPGNKYSPDWSPDGTKIIFYKQQFDGRDLYIMDANGNNITRITGEKGEEFLSTLSPGKVLTFDFYDQYMSNLFPSFLPDGKHVKFIPEDASKSVRAAVSFSALMCRLGPMEDNSGQRTASSGVSSTPN